MNKHVRSIFLSVVVGVFFGLFFAAATPASVSAATTGAHVVIPLKYARDKPSPNLNLNCPYVGRQVPLKDCLGFDSGVGVYYFVGQFSQASNNNISNVSVVDETLKASLPPDSSADVSVQNVDYKVAGKNLEIYGDFTRNHKYSFYFNFSDQKSLDISLKVSDTEEACKSATAAGQVAQYDPEAARIATKVVEPKAGCDMYDSDTTTINEDGTVFQFLPGTLAVVMTNKDKGYVYGRSGELIPTVDLNAIADQQKQDAVNDQKGTASSSLCGYEDSKALNWIYCPITSALQNATNKLSDQLVNLLYFPTDRIFYNDGTSANDGMRQAWATFRNIALALILIAGLVMVISQAAGLEILDAYTIRKLMPRLAIALIGIALSWPLMNFAIGFFNDIGTWTYAAIVTPFKDMPVASERGIGTGVASLGIIILGAPAFLVYLYALGALGALSLLFTVGAALFIGLLVLAIRWAIIAIALLLAPLAIAAYVLPGTQKLWGFWKNTLLTTLMMFPIVMGLIAAGNVMARVATAIGADNYFFILIMYFAPFFMLPFAFKLAGGLMTTIFSLANDKSRGIFDRARNYRANSAKRRWGEYASGDRGTKGFGKYVVGNAAMISKSIGDPAHGNLLTKQGRAVARQKLAERGGHESLKNNELQWTANDYALMVGEDDTATAANKVDKYLGHKFKGSAGAAAWAALSVAERQNERTLAARELDVLEQGVGAKIGTHRMLAAASHARDVSKTGYAAGDEGMEEIFNNAIHEVSAGRMTATQAMGIIKQAQRLEHSSISYSEGVKMIQKHVDAGTTMQQTDVDDMFQSAIQFMQPSQLAGARHETVRGMSEHLMKRLDAAFASGDKREIGRAMADMASMRDSINYYNPENAKLFADMVAAQPAGTTGTTVRDYEEVLRANGDPDFLDHRKEWSSNNPNVAAAAAAMQQGQVPAPGVAPPPPPAAGQPSDMRLKKHITHLETLSSGINLYGFEYVWGGPTYVGVMAQELLETHPEAVGVDANGYYFVDYSMLGIKMMTLREWQQTHELLRS